MALSFLAPVVAKIKYAFAVYFLFGGVPITLVTLLVRARKLIHSNFAKFAAFFTGYLAFTKLLVQRYPLGVRSRNSDFSLTRALIEPLYRLQGGRVIDAATVPLDPSTSYLFACAPHGLLTFEWLVALTTLPAVPPVALGASVIFRIPFIRELYSFWSVEASPENFERILAARRSICVIPGGVSEMMLSTPGQTVKVSTKNKGFIRMALKYGMPVVPVFAFGQHNLWHQKRLPEVISRPIAKATGGTYPFLPWGSFAMFLPNADSRVVHVFGDPVRMPRILGDISPQEVDYHHARFYRALAETVNTTKHEAGFADLNVVFVGMEHLNVGLPKGHHPSTLNIRANL